jgi:hypothetical protein
VIAIVIARRIARDTSGTADVAATNFGLTSTLVRSGVDWPTPAKLISCFLVRSIFFFSADSILLVFRQGKVVFFIAQHVKQYPANFGEPASRGRGGWAKRIKWIKSLPIRPSILKIKHVVRSHCCLKGWSMKMMLTSPQKPEIVI